ncbi:hypothetical protein I307_06071 [Cryptococcus deuterogattii 99/473]|uniref:Mediator of RNA polymerase II transcription subunit 14 n=1 Tax=Cryptococcus deuterogattii Ram5 TaxID=1296110 RepID=A0A0D0UY69_9TREE|nr:hypothetical protein I313_06409 [Cryptococcus deuterogattii Ram5]KIY54596.1 hypothetical protein I307_06071 [Cryptococcus deuterogattii 99/473]
MASAPIASVSEQPSTSTNPQLGPEPYFAYPTPTPEQLEEELPPYFENENVPLGLVLDRFARKGNHDLRVLLGEVLPQLPIRERPKPIIEYAKTTRQALLKYLAVLRWKTSVDIASTSAGSSVTNTAGPASFPTPHSNNDPNDNSPDAFAGKGKGKAQADELVIKGKVTDAKRIAHFMEHQNQQHEVAIEHVKHVTKVVEGLRERNPDLLTALSLLSTGTYNRLPTSLVDPYLAKPALTNSAILRVLRRLNRQIRYRLRCLDYFPPELIVEDIKDGRMYARGDGWRAELTVVGFEDTSRWWLTGVEWGWKAKEKGVDDPGGRVIKKFTGEERQGILDIANGEVLSPRELPDEKNEMEVDTVVTEDPQVKKSELVEVVKKTVDAPLLEVLFTQAIALSQGKWRGQLIPEMDRENKTLRLKYWLRERPVQVQRQDSTSNKRSQAPTTLATSRQPMVGGIIHISLAEKTTPRSELDNLLSDIACGGLVPSERVLKLKLGVKWVVDEAGDPDALSAEDLLHVCTRTHASHLTRSHGTSLLTSPRFLNASSVQPSLQESTDPSARPLTLRVPLPSRYAVSHLLIGVSPFSGLLEVEDEGAKGNDARAERATMSMKSVNEGKTKLVDDITRLTTAIVVENIEAQMRQLGWKPTRQIALRLKGIFRVVLLLNLGVSDISADLIKADLHPIITVFIPLASSPNHYFVAKAVQNGIVFELLKVAKVPNENGLGMRYIVGDRTMMDLGKLRARRKGGDDKPQRSAALVAQTIVEQQLKDRSIPYTQQFPPTTGPASPKSTSPLAGMVPTICVDVRDLLRAGRGGRSAAMEVAMPKVWLQIEGWWEGGKCEVVTIVVLRHQPSTVAPQTASQDSESKKDSAESVTAEGISFDPKSSIVRFRAKDISRCVPAFLEQWERLSKVIAVAGEVSRLNKTESFKDVKMLSFDLRTAVLQYAPGYNASITYSPTDDSYRITFFLSSPSSDTDRNPHELLAPLLSAKLNELTSTDIAGKNKAKGQVGREFMGLLKNTLPVLKLGKTLGIEKGWSMVVLGVAKYRLVKDHDGKRFAVDVTLLPDLEHYLIQDGATPRGPDHVVDVYTGPLTSLEMDKVIRAVFDTEKTISAETGDEEKIQGKNRRVPPVMKLDQGKSLVCEVERSERVLRKVMEEASKVMGLGNNMEMDS